MIIGVSRDLWDQTPVCAICSQNFSTLLITSLISSVPLPSPPPSDQNASLPSNPPSNIRAHHNSDRPRLPRPIPIQRDGYRAEPRAYQRASRGAKDLVQRRGEGQDLKPVSGRQGAGVEEREEGEEGNVQGQECGVREMRCEWCAEEDGG